MLAFDRHKISFSAGLRFRGPDLRRLGPVMADPATSNQNFGCPVLRLPDGRLRLYYVREGLREEILGARSARYAESADGLEWADRGELPVAGLPEGTQIRHLSVLPPEGGDPLWRMFAWAFNFPDKLVRYVRLDGEDGVHWTCAHFDRPCLVHPGDRDAAVKPGFEGLLAGPVAASVDPDAVAADERFRRRRNLSNDATATYRLPGGGFECFSVWLADNPEGGPNRTPVDNVTRGFRVIQRRHSADGLEFSRPEIVLPFDERGPYQLQHYYLNQTRCGAWRLGMLGRYPCERQTIEPELVVSRDGRAWERPYPAPWIRLEDEGPDAGLIHTGHHFLDCGETWRVYYSVSRFPHNQRALRPGAPRPRGIYAAEVAKGRLLGLAGSGLVETKPLVFTDGLLAVDGNVRGALRAELLDLNGRALPGRTFAESVPVAGSGPALELRWRGQEQRHLCCEMVSLRLAIDDGVFYRLK